MSTSTPDKSFIAKFVQFQLSEALDKSTSSKNARVIEYWDGMAPVVDLENDEIEVFNLNDHQGGFCFDAPVDAMGIAVLDSQNDLHESDEECSVYRIVTMCQFGRCCGESCPCECSFSKSDSLSESWLESESWSESESDTSSSESLDVSDESSTSSYSCGDCCDGGVPLVLNMEFHANATTQNVSLTYNSTLDAWISEDIDISWCTSTVDDILNITIECCPVDDRLSMSWALSDHGPAETEATTFDCSPFNFRFENPTLTVLGEVQAIPAPYSFSAVISESTALLTTPSPSANTGKPVVNEDPCCARLVMFQFDGDMTREMNKQNAKVLAWWDGNNPGHQVEVYNMRDGEEIECSLSESIEEQYCFNVEDGTTGIAVLDLQNNPPCNDESEVSEKVGFYRILSLCNFGECNCVNFSESVFESESVAEPVLPAGPGFPLSPETQFPSGQTIPFGFKP